VGELLADGFGEDCVPGPWKKGGEEREGLDETLVHACPSYTCEHMHSSVAERARRFASGTVPIDMMEELCAVFPGLQSLDAPHWPCKNEPFSR
jgi:hypothetical protein